MTTIEVKIPGPALKQAKELAEREQISLEQLISLAVTQAIGGWSNQTYLALRAQRGSREDFLKALEVRLRKSYDNLLPNSYDTMV